MELRTFRMVVSVRHLSHVSVTIAVLHALPKCWNCSVAVAVGGGFPAAEVALGRTIARRTIAAAAAPLAYFMDASAPGSLRSTVRKEPGSVQGLDDRLGAVAHRLPRSR